LKTIRKLLANADANKDGALTLKEIRRCRCRRAKRPTAEHFMPDLKNPSSKGTKMEPVFFVNGKRPQPGFPTRPPPCLGALHHASSDPWFSRPSSIGSGRNCWAKASTCRSTTWDAAPGAHAEVLDLLADAFVANNCDMQWLFRTIARTDAYQREIRAKDPRSSRRGLCRSSPKRLRSDQLFNAITKVLGIEGADQQASEGAVAGKGKNRYARGPRAQFEFLSVTTRRPARTT